MVEENEKNNKVTVVNKDKVIILSIVISVVVICLVTFGIYMYKTSYKEIAKFDGGKVTRDEYALYYNMFMPMLQMYGYPAETIPKEIAKKASLDKIVEMIAKNDNMTLTEEEKNEINKVFEDKEQLEQMKENNINIEEFRKLYERDAIVQRYIKKMQDELSEEDIKNYLVENYGKDVNLNEYVTRNLLISTTDKESGKPVDEAKKTEAKNKAIAAIARLNKGEKFENLVKELSDDEGTKEDGGLYNVYLDERTVKEYTDAVLKLEVGKYTSEPVESQFGYHVIFLEKINPEGRLKSKNEKDPAMTYKLEALNKKYNLAIDEKALESYSSYLNAEIMKMREEAMKKQEEESKKQENKKDEVDVYDKK